MFRFVSASPQELEESMHLHVKDNTTRLNHFNKVYDKPWGKEYLIYQNDKLGIWILHINKDQGTSTHCHFKKDSIIIPLSGTFRINLYKGYTLLNELDQLYVPRRVFHGLQSYADDSVVMEIEIYTEDIKYTDKNDLFRLRDQYERSDKTGYGSSVRERSPQPGEIMNFHTDHLFGNISITHGDLCSESGALSIILEGELFHNGSRLCQGAILNNAVQYSKLTKEVSVLTLTHVAPESHKIIRSLNHLRDMLSHPESKLGRIGLTSGCFDIIHYGHIRNLKQAKAQCDTLFVCLSSDAQVRELKGKHRPVNNIIDRQSMLVG